MNKKRLGKGLSALIPEMPQQEQQEQDEKGVYFIPLNRIVKNSKQPRKNFAQEKLNELAMSIKEHGIIQPVIIRKANEKMYELIAGERRFRAAIIAGLTEIPAIIKDLQEENIMELALIENLQREDLNPLEEAEAYRQLIEEYGLTQEQLAKRLGKSRPFITNMLRILNVDDFVKESLLQDKISLGHARALISIMDKHMQRTITKEIIKYTLSVRETEKLVKKYFAKRNEEKPKIANKIFTDPYIVDIQERLQHIFGTQISIKAKDVKKNGKIEINFNNGDDLNRIVDILLGEEI